mmetsp:Transcript_20700/g.53409  ORF Transcript_20700/g.53409 Transcript_20700/m.53409 type:complete len:124 (+) Transcript_20700:679-1050(+)
MLLHAWTALVGRGSTQVSFSILQQVDFSEILAHVDFIKNSPFGERMLEVYDLDCSRKLMLKEFAMLCSIFVPSCPREKKLKFLFDLYDLDNDGGLSTEDVFDSIKKMVSSEQTLKQHGGVKWK